MFRLARSLIEFYYRILFLRKIKGSRSRLWGRHL